MELQRPVPNTIQIMACVICGNPNLQTLRIFPEFPVFMGVTKDIPASDHSASMHFSICTHCDCIQLVDLPPEVLVYQASHGSGTVGESWTSHHAQFSAFLDKCLPKRVFEIGGGGGRLELEYRTRFRQLEWTILDLNPMPMPESKAHFLQGSLDSSVICSFAPFETVVLSHTFEHIRNPAAFLALLGESMQTAGNLVLSVPNLEIMLKRGYTNFMKFEHPILYTAELITQLLASNGFRIVSLEKFREDHSLFIHAIASARQHSIFGSKTKRRVMKHLFARWARKQLSWIALVNAEMEKSHNPTYLHGGHVSSQYLFAFGLSQILVRGILDNDAKKLGLRLYGTRQYVINPASLRKQECTVIIPPSVYVTELSSQYKSTLGSQAFILT